MSNDRASFIPGSVYATEVDNVYGDIHDASHFRLLSNGTSWAGFVLGAPGDANAPQAWIAKNPPGQRVPRHCHHTHRLEVVIAGSYTENGIERGAGSFTLFPAGQMYGPIDAGPEGYTAVEIFSTSTDMHPMFEDVPDNEALAVLTGFGFRADLWRTEPHPTD